MIEKANASTSISLLSILNIIEFKNGMNVGMRSCDWTCGVKYPYVVERLLVHRVETSDEYDLI